MALRSQAWTGSFVLEIGRSVYVGPGRHAAMHAHHAMQACVGLDAPLRIRTSSRGPWAAHDGCVIAAGQSHEFDAEGRPVALLFLEPEGPDGRRVAAATGWRGVTPLPAVAVARVRGLAGDTGSEGGRVDAERFLEALGIEAGETRPMDARIRKAVVALRRCSGEYPSSADLAASLGLSPGRFRHLWLAETGLAYRRYLLWLRLGAALGHASRTATLTEAAHESGFADAAHLARTFRRLLGITPSSMPVAAGTAARDRKGSANWAR